MNWTIKNSLGKVCQETRLKWVQALPLVLFKIRCTPSRKTGYSPYEILYHRPPLILRALPGTPRDHVWIKDWSAAPLKPRWKGPQTSYYTCTGTQKGTCLYNGTQYKVCRPGDGQPDVCYNPSEPPIHTTFEIRLLTGQWNSPTKLIAKTEERRSPKQVTLRFDACAAINAYPSGGGNCGSLRWEPSYAT
ncbi:Endogenous retrovirus group 3 member 1 Env polyprotein [Plecturocebus cupreus]